MPVAFASVRGGWGAAASPAPAAPAATNTTPTPADNGGQIAVPNTSPEGATTQPATGQPFRAFASQAELDDFVKGSKSQAERAAIRKLAKDLGFEDAEEMRQALQSLRQGQGGDGPAPSPSTPETTATTTTAEGPSASARLAMAIKVGAEMNLPAALINRLQGDTEEEMRADAQQLLGMVGSGATRGPGIPPVPAGNSPVTFTRTQLQDAKFVRANAAAIRQAHAQGRIVNS